MPLPTRNKYGAKKTVRHGVTFDSGVEADRYSLLLDHQRKGIIRELECDKKKLRYPLIVNGIKKVLIGHYTPDFRYIDTASGLLIVEDVKSVATKKARDYGLRKKLMLACHGIEIHEVMM